MNKLFGLLLVPCGLAGALWSSPLLNGATDRSPSQSRPEFRLEVRDIDLTRQARTDVLESLADFHAHPGLERAMDLYEQVLVLEARREHRCRRLESFGPHNLPVGTSEAATHYVLGSEPGGWPVVPVSPDAEPDYWILEALLEASSDPWFEPNAEALLERVETRAAHALESSARLRGSQG